MMEAEFSFEYASSQLARSIKTALEPDNVLGKNNGMNISAYLKGRTVKITLSRCPRIESLQATIDDIFRCVRGAEAALSVTSDQRRKNKRFK